MNEIEHDAKLLLREAGEEMAHKAMAAVQTLARRQHHEVLVKRLMSMKQYLPDPKKDGFQNAIDYLQMELDEPLNWIY